MFSNIYKQREKSFRSYELCRRQLICRKGVSLVELLLVIAVVGILAVALGFSYQGWMGAYKVEKEIKEIYSDLMTARATAMARDREYFADFNNTASLDNPVQNVTAPCYRIIGDTAPNTTPAEKWLIDGDGEWDVDSDGKIDSWHTVLPTYPKTVAYPIDWSNFSATPLTLVFDRKGLITRPGNTFGATICLSTTADPDFDCLIISQTRINMGKLTIQRSLGGACDSANCVAK